MKTIEREEARKYYVESLFSIGTILSVMGEKVSRKSLFNWRNEDDWDKQRSEFLFGTKSLRESLYKVAAVALAEAQENPTNANQMFAAAKIIGAMETFKAAGLDNFGHPEVDETVEKKALSEATFDKLKVLLGLK